MPIVTIEGPALQDVNKKRSLVEDVTETVAKAYDFPASSIIVLLKENTAENVGVGGKLVADMHE